jgi:hypothetical protein
MAPLLKSLRMSPPGRAAAWLKHSAVQWRRERVAKTILRLPPRPVPPPGPELVSIHLLTSRRDWLGALWSARTFLAQLKKDLPVVFHDDGTLPLTGKRALQESLPGAVVWDFQDATERMAEKLQGRPRCLEARKRHPTVLKLLDIPLLTDGRRFLTLDSDLLFFAPPTEVKAWLDGEPRHNFWNKDIICAYNITLAEALEWYGIHLLENINSGFGGVHLESLDLDLAEDFLGKDSAWTMPHRTEQTTWALLSSRYGAQLLPRSYLLDIDPGAGLPPGTVMKHYVGNIRNLFFFEGIQHLLDTGFVPQCSEKAACT